MRKPQANFSEYKHSLTGCKTPSDCARTSEWDAVCQLHKLKITIFSCTVFCFTIVRFEVIQAARLRAQTVPLCSSTALESTWHKRRLSGSERHTKSILWVYIVFSSESYQIYELCGVSVEKIWTSINTCSNKQLCLDMRSHHSHIRQQLPLFTSFYYQCFY